MTALELAKQVKELAAKCPAKGKWQSFDCGAWGGEGAGVGAGNDADLWFSTRRPTTNEKADTGHYLAAAANHAPVLADRVIELEAQNNRWDAKT